MNRMKLKGRPRLPSLFSVLDRVGGTCSGQGRDGTAERAAIKLYRLEQTHKAPWLACATQQEVVIHLGLFLQMHKL